ncbi:MAG: mevalonate kinase, partial [Thermoprotei archaeon]
MVGVVLASAPAKVILVGEHFVVENQPAIAVAVELRARARATPRSDDRVVIRSANLGLECSFAQGEEVGVRELRPLGVVVREVQEAAGSWRGLELTVESDIPVAAGMGSSAAVAVAATLAVSRLLGLKLSREEVSRIAYEAERLVHGKPSGIDNTISTYGGAIVYRRSEGFLPLDCDFTGYKLVLADSGIPRSTGEMVARVRELRARHPRIMEPLYHAAGRLTIEAAKALRDGDFARLGELMNINHGLLSAIGVSNEKLEQLIYAARRAGALGAKIT